MKNRSEKSSAHCVKNKDKRLFNDKRNECAMSKTEKQHSHIALFKGKVIRKIIYKNEWWFSVVDVVQALVDQADDLTARKYCNKLAQRLRDEGSEVVTNCHQLKLMA